MSLPHAVDQHTHGRMSKWFMHGHVHEPDGPGTVVSAHQYPWWQVVCLTGVDYFSSLGYQPGIAALAAGVLSPIATLVLILVTLGGALPMYRWVAGKSPRGDGSVSMLEHLLPWWQGKLFVLGLIGFVATGFIITITLSAADAAAHIGQNPFAHRLHGYETPITLLLITLLGLIFLKGFNEAIGIAVALVAVYLTLNVIVIGNGLRVILQSPHVLAAWHTTVLSNPQTHGSPLLIIALALVLFPKLALGLSGFETGVLVMPLIKGDPTDTPKNLAGRIRNGRKLLTAAAVIMSVLLLTSSVVTTLLIPQHAFAQGGAANGRALAYLAHLELGNVFGTLYDISTICILWFAGASAMAGLLNIVPRYLPRYGMAPDWARATRPLVLIFSLICFLVTIVFQANVDKQAGAYATGVLALMTSATIAVTLSARRNKRRRALVWFSLVSLVFIYTLVSTIIAQPQGLKIAAIFIVAIVVISLVSRVWRSTELRVTDVQMDVMAQRLIAEACKGTLRLIANHPDERNEREYLLKEREQRAESHIPRDEPVLFLEVTVTDASDFANVLHVHGKKIGDYKVLRIEAASVANGIAAFLLYLRDTTGKRPHIYFGWTEGNPLKYLVRYILFGEGDIAPLTHEVLRQNEPDPVKRPAIHVG